MKRLKSLKKLTATSGLLLLALGLAPQVQAATLASLDFGNGSTQAGFTPISSLATTTVGTPNGDLTITFTNGNGFFDRAGAGGLPVSGSGGFSYNNLYNDWFFLNSTGTSTITLGGPAIAPNTSYDIRIWAYDESADTGAEHTVTLGVTAGTAGSPSPIVYTPDTTLTDNFQFSDFTTYTANGSGEIQITASDVNNGITNGFNGALRLPGLTIAEIPEPSGAVLALFGIAGLLVRRRR